MKKYCVDLEIALELKVNGFPQKTKYAYRRFVSSWDLCDQSFGEGKYQERFSAPISDEILDYLPSIVEYNGCSTYINIDIFKDFYSVELEGYKISYVHFWEEKLSNALAKMWLYLKKEVSYGRDKNK